VWSGSAERIRPGLETAERPIFTTTVKPMLLSGASASRRRSTRARRRRAGIRLAPLLVLGAIAFTVGVVIGAGPHRAQRKAAQRFATAWSRGDLATMYELLSDDARSGISFARFSRVYGKDAATASLARVVAGRASKPRSNTVAVPVTLVTRAFGSLPAVLRLRMEGDHIRWSKEDAFPLLRPGEKLRRTTSAPPRGTLLARNGATLAQGLNRASTLGPVATQIVGELGPAPPDQRASLRAAGFPSTTPVGLTGLERVFQNELAGTPGGTLLAGHRRLAHTAPRQAPAVRTSIDPGIEQAAIAALAGRYGGAVAMDPRTGEILALAGVAYSALQPPGSTFKIITATAALEAHDVKMTDTFPVLTGATLEGRTIQNANGESCGGTFIQAFANSCNSVFAPLGAKVGGAKLVATAERFGFNRDPGIPGAATPTIPDAETIGDALAVGSSAIGQGRVQASALEMTTVAATIAEHGRRPRPSLLLHPRPRFERVTSAAVARQVRRLMLAVVAFGTGTAAQIPGVKVAGKTGTAELKDTTKPAGEGPDAQAQPQQPDPKNTDAWFVAFAPAGHPRVAVGVLLTQAGAGGAAAAPVAHDILVKALQR
jgi:Penicillin binding protein transpeptidase domain/Penicillin-binding Protein dimerisation domain